MNSSMIELSIAVLGVLERIATVGPKDSSLGLCANVCELLPTDTYCEESVDCLLTHLFESWPDKSNNSTYPVGNWIRHPRKLYWHFHANRRDMWDVDTRYGAARRALLVHCHTKLTELIKKGD